MRKSREVRVGKLVIGGGAPVSVQTMGNCDPHDAAACLKQLVACAERGCDLFRLTVPDEAAAKAFAEVRKASPIPIVADIHFDHRLALAALAAGADAVRINPGNIGGAEKTRLVLDAAKARGAAVRIGVNGGSLEKGETIVSSALKALELCAQANFDQVVLSAKVSSAVGTIAVYRELAAATDVPLHLGVTEAGTLLPGTVRNSVALGVLLSEGIGDTLRVSLTAKPEKEVKVGLEILRALGLRAPGPAVTSCPTCGRTRVDVQRVATCLEDALETLGLEHPPHVAVMGCAVNGPGEAKGADIALCGGNGDFVLYLHGEPAGRVSEAEAVNKVVEHVVSMQ